jgi:signal transduction histidine kinase
MEPTTLKILMLEDLEEDAGLVDRVLQKADVKFVRERVDTPQEFVDALNQFNPDVILSDHALPQFNSIEALKICHEQKLDIPFILVTGAVSDEFAVNCLKMGADDYVLKTNLSRLPQAISQALRKHRAEREKYAQAEALHRQNEELKKINSEIDAFVYRVSHDIRSPLASVLGIVNLARLENGIDEKSGRYFDLIGQSISKLDTTLRGILDYYKNARGEILIEEVNLEELVYETFEQLKFSKDFDEVKKEITVQHAIAYTDRYRVTAIVANLISNALKYFDTTKTERLVNVTIQVTHQQILISVKDNGMGISEEHLPKIFDMFYRATEKSQGAGLGLYIVKEMVEKLNGDIKVKSEYGLYTEFNVALLNHISLA